MEEEALKFKSGAASSKIPRFDLIPYHPMVRVANRFEAELIKHKERSWNALSDNQHCLTDPEFVIARVGHAISHSFKLLKKINQGQPVGDDDAAAIAWAGMCLCAATEPVVDTDLPLRTIFTFDGGGNEGKG